MTNQWTNIPSYKDTSFAYIEPSIPPILLKNILSISFDDQKASRTDGLINGLTDGQTDSLIEMRGRTQELIQGFILNALEALFLLKISAFSSLLS